MDHQTHQPLAPTYPPAMHHAPPMMHQQLPTYPLRNITQPHYHDVLCGRGGGTNAHVGNSHWRMLVAANKELYCTLPKKQKMLLSKSIVNAVRSQNPPGRFLQKDPKTSLWYDVGDQRAQEKTSQALREGAPTIRTKIKGSADSAQDDDSDESPPNKEKTTTPEPAAPTMSVPPPQHNPMPPMPQGMPPHMHHPMMYPPHPQMPVPGPAPYGMMPPHGMPLPYAPHHMPPAPTHMATMGIPAPIPAQGPVPDRRAKQNSRNNEPTKPGDKLNSPTVTTKPKEESSSTSPPRPSPTENKATEENSAKPENVSISPRKHSLEPLPMPGGDMPRPPVGLTDDVGCSFGSIDMTDMEQIRLMSGGSFGVGVSPKFPAAQPQVHFREEDLIGKDGPRRPSLPMGAPLPVDGGLEPIGFSFGSLMSIGSSENAACTHITKLDTGGLSFGSAMSYSVRGDVPQVDGGLEAIGASFGSLSIDREKVFPPGSGMLDNVGTSFGSMTISTQDRDDLLYAVGAGETKEPSEQAVAELQAATQTTFLAQQKSRGSLLECSDTESEDEEESAQNSAQKSAEWEKLQATIAAQSKLPMSSTTPPRLVGKRAPKEQVPTNIPLSSFHRDYSQMSAISVGDSDFAHYQEQVMPEVGVGYQETEDQEAMPPPPPPMQKQPADDVNEDDFDDFEALQRYERKDGLLD